MIYILMNGKRVMRNNIMRNQFSAQMWNSHKKKQELTTQFSLELHYIDYHMYPFHNQERSEVAGTS